MPEKDDISNAARLTIALAALIGVVLFGAPRAGAIDGVVDLNQARALLGQLSESDTAGFPITISKPGSYRLTSNLVVENAFTDAIAVQANDVTIDLNGFSIVGPTSCSEPPVLCTPTGIGVGVLSDLEAENVAVIDGVVRGMGFSAVLLHDRARVERVRATSNGANGIQVDEGSAVVESSAYTNGGDGIRTLRDSEVIGCIASLNGANGIETGDGSRVADSVATANGSAGIDAGNGSTVIGNAVWANGGLGLIVEGSSGYAHNVLTANNGGDSEPQVSAFGLQIGGNFCGEALCP
jgi:hypothetical protein